MNIEPQAVVRTEDGMEVGRIERVVLNPESREVTHLVLKKGVLPEDKVVPMGLVGAGTEEGVTLRAEEEDLEHLPPFEEKHVVELGERPGAAPIQPMNLFPGPGIGQPVVSLGSAGPSEPRAVVEVTRNIPDGTVALKASAKVVAADGRNVGRLEQILTDSKTDRITDLVIAQGFLGRTHRRIPMRWVQQVGESVVDLEVGSATVEEAGLVAR